MKSAIILIDIQNDYFSGGKNELHCPEQAALYAKQALDFFRSHGLPIYHIQHISIQQGATFFLPDSTGSEINQSVAPQAGEKVFVKHAPNAFFQTGLSEEMIQQNFRHLVICGMMSHMCIDTTVRAAKDFGFLVTVLEDACSTKDLIWNDAVITADTVHKTIMASLNGTFAQVVQTNKFLADIKNL